MLPTTSLPQALTGRGLEADTHRFVDPVDLRLLLEDGGGDTEAARKVVIVGVEQRNCLTAGLPDSQVPAGGCPPVATPEVT
jgi:hypothetical protein